MLISLEYAVYLIKNNRSYNDDMRSILVTRMNHIYNDGICYYTNHMYGIAYFSTMSSTVSLHLNLLDRHSEIFVDTFMQPIFPQSLPQTYAVDLTMVLSQTEYLLSRI